MKNNVYEVFHPIAGLIVDTPEPVSIGDFTFYQFPRDQKKAVTRYFCDADNKFVESFFHHMRVKNSVVSVKVRSSDYESAIVMAETLFMKLTNVFRFQLFDYREVYGVSILTEKMLMTSSYTVISDNLEGHRQFSISGVRRQIELSKFFEIDGRGFSRLVENQTARNLTKMEKRMLLAVDFCGLSTENIGQPSSFIHAVTALECLLSTSDRGIRENVANNYAILFGDTPSKQEELKKRIKSLYKTRSKLAHGEISIISKDECLKAIYYARETLIIFLMDDVLSTLKGKADFSQYLKELSTQKKESGIFEEK